MTIIPHPPQSARRASAAPSRVLIVDDSLTMRAVLSRIVEAEKNLETVGKFGSAELALDALDRLIPDIILLDLELPGMSGLDALPKILAMRPEAQVLVISSLTAAGAEATVQALAMGAVDTMPKPDHASNGAASRMALTDSTAPRNTADMTPAALFARELRLKLRGLSGRRPGASSTSSRNSAAHIAPAARKPGMHASNTVDAVAIGASTGGIHALIQLLRALPPSVTAPILVTQHLPAAFIPVFARQLTAAANRPAIVAAHGMTLQHAHIYVAPGGGHLDVVAKASGLEVCITTGPMPSGCSPSVDPMLASLATATQGRALGVMLSGMGRDGAAGAQTLFEAGGTILAQDEASSAVWGMPRAVIEAGLVMASAPPAALALRIAALAGSGEAGQRSIRQVRVEAKLAGVAS